MLNIKAWPFNRAILPLIIGIVMAIMGGVIVFPLSFVLGSNVLIGCCLFPFVLLIEGKHRFSYMYFVAMLFFGVAAFFYNVRSFYFFALAFYVLFLLELYIGRINSMVLYLLVFMSPFFHQISVILGFSFRLQLSQWAGYMLSLLGFDIQVQGNIMQLDGSSFTVDEACVGLHMLAISMLMGYFVIAHLYKAKKLKLSMGQLTIYFAIVFLFNIISNLLRIMVLVAFKIPPENPMHEIIGILCLCLYVICPLYFLGRWEINRYGKPFNISCEGAVNNVFNTSMMTMLSIAILYVGIHVCEKRKQSSVLPASANVSFDGLQVLEMKDGITKMVNDQMLIYVKPIPEFYSGEHLPLMCWVGSGYVFKNIDKMTIAENEIYCGQLTKSDDKLFTAWWYSNGDIQTINQMDWRFRMLKGEQRFCLVNVTARDKETLKSNLESIFTEKLLTINNAN